MDEILTNMIRGQTKRPQEYSPLVLAYVGDAVYEAYVRTHLVKGGNIPVHHLHRMSTNYVSAKAQSDIIEALLDSLDEEEIRVFKRGRNAKAATTPKNADLNDYRRATGFEALVGYLYLCGRFGRLEEVLELAIKYRKGEEK